VLGEVVIVIVVEPPDITVAGPNEADAPDGRPWVENESSWGLPAVTLVEMVEVLLNPAVTLVVQAFADTPKSSAARCPQPGRLNDPIRVRQTFSPSTDRYCPVYQNVQPSLGSTPMLV
jgi:hypothetical protein